MARLLFDRRARLVCGALWAIAWFGVAALLLLPLGVSTPGGSDLFGHFLLFATMAFAAVGFSRRPGQRVLLGAEFLQLGFFGITIERLGQRILLGFLGRRLLLAKLLKLGGQRCALRVHVAPLTFELEFAEPANIIVRFA